MTPRRIASQQRTQVPHSAPGDSRKDALWGCHSHEKAHFACGPHQRAHSACGRSRRVRFSVRARAQNALFRRVRFSSPAQTRRHLTQRRILRRPPHGKPHSATGNSRKSTLCTRQLTEKHTLHPPSYVKAQSAPGDSRKDALWGLTLTEKRILHRRCHLDMAKRRVLGGRRHGEAHFACGPHQRARSICGRSRRVRLSVRARAQNALFREGPRPECTFP